MADWKLSPADLRILVDIMTRSGLFNTPTQRENFFAFSGYADVLPRLQSSIPLTDGTDEFCRTLVRRLLVEGLSPDGSHHAIYFLFRYILTSISGQATEKMFVEKIMEESEVSLRRQQLSISQTSTPINLEIFMGRLLRISLMKNGKKYYAWWSS